MKSATLASIPGVKEEDPRAIFELGTLHRLAWHRCRHFSGEGATRPARALILFASSFFSLSLFFFFPRSFASPLTLFSARREAGQGRLWCRVQSPQPPDVSDGGHQGERRLLSSCLADGVSCFPGGQFISVEEEGAIQEVAKEIRVLDGCDNPNIVRYLGCFKVRSVSSLAIVFKSNMCATLASR